MVRCRKFRLAAARTAFYVPSAESAACQIINLWLEQSRFTPDRCHRRVAGSLREARRHRMVWLLTPLAQG